MLSKTLFSKKKKYIKIYLWLYLQDEIEILSSKTFHDTMLSHFSNFHILPPISNLYESRSLFKKK